MSEKTYKGGCFCGAVQLFVTGDPVSHSLDPQLWFPRPRFGTNSLVTFSASKISFSCKFIGCDSGQ